MRLIIPTLSVALAALAGGCVAVPENPAGAPTVAPTTTTAAVPVGKSNRYFELHGERRIHVFTDPALYAAFKESGELAYVRTRIGEGPGGKTLVFGISAEEARQPLSEPSLPERAWADPAAVLLAQGFFGLIERNGRDHVSDDLSSFLLFRSSGEAAYSQTRIGAGKGGRSIVFVHDKDQVGKPLPNAEALYRELAR